MKLTEGFIAVPGGKVWYGIAGSERPGIPLVVLHGGPGAPHDYLEVLAELKRPVIFYDQLGCGNSERPEDSSLWTIDRFIDELIAVWQTLGLSEFHLLGQSWGSLLAGAYMVRDKPQQVRSLVLSGPFLSASRWLADQQDNLANLPKAIQRVVQRAESICDYASPLYQEAMQTYYQQHLCRLEPWPESLNRTMEKMGMPVYLSMCGPSEFTLIGSLKQTELADRLAEISIPVLFTCGRYDEATPETTAWYQQALPGSELVIFEDASHSHHLEKTVEYLQAVEDFLQRVEQRNRSS